MKNGIWNIVAIVIAVIWGATFVSSKILINAGLTPAEIMTIRFVIAYLCILPISLTKALKSQKGLKSFICENKKDELKMMLVGITGGSLYFIFENTALEYTQASNVSIIITATPLLTMLASAKAVKKKAFLFSAISLVGVAAVVLNGELVLKLHPMGDLLTLGAAVCWVIYSLMLVSLEKNYSTEMITRKVFFYGVLTMLPSYLFQPWSATLELMSNPIIWGNLLFLGCLASFGCFYIWNAVLKRLGAVQANNFLYINPLATALLAIPVLGERFTWVSVLGTALIFTGMYFASKSIQITK